jgi:predicted HTH transcriptional regulator
VPSVPPSLRSLALGDVTSADLRWMIKEGEALVELKATIPSEGIGPTISSFANSLGGWVILGVEDRNRAPVGWKPPGRADDLDYLRERLRQEVDPMPPFAAKPMRVDRYRVSVIRVYESTDTPHIVRGTGTVFVRDPGAKRPIAEHDHMIELARRGETAGQRARDRLSAGLEANRLLLQDEPNSGKPSIRMIAREPHSP